MLEVAFSRPDVLLARLQRQPVRLAGRGRVDADADQRRAASA
jgi:hypothetical protein